MQAAPLRPTHHDDDEPRPPGLHPDNGRQPPSSRPEAHQREAAVEGLISLSQLPPLVAPSQPPPLRPLPLRKRKPSMPPSGPPHRHLHKQEQQPSSALPAPARPALSPSGLLLQQCSSSSSAPPSSSPEEAALPLLPLASLGRVMAPYYLTRGPPSSPPPPPLKRLRTATLPSDAGAFGLDSSAADNTRRRRRRRRSSESHAQRIISTSKGPEEEASDRATSSPSSSSSSSSKPIAREAGPGLEPASPPRPSGAMAEDASAASSGGAAAQTTATRVKEEKGDEEEEKEGEGEQQEGQEEEEEGEEEEAEERERRAVERCLDLGVERNVVEALSTAGVSAERIVELILSEDKEQREGIIRGTGLSKNYIMKLQRRALRTSAHLQLPSPLAHSFRSGLVLHVLFDSHDRALFIKKELCRLLNMKGTTFSYWKKKAGVSDIDTSQDFRLMDKCRSIFGGRSTYTLYSAEQMLAILQCMQRSRQKNCFTNVSELTALIASYSCYPLPHHPPSPLSLLLPAVYDDTHLDNDAEDNNGNDNNKTDANEHTLEISLPPDAGNGEHSSLLPTTETARRPFTTADPR